MTSTSSGLVEEQPRRPQFQLGANYIPTDDEKRVLRECNEEGFWYRSVPTAAISMAVVQALIARGTLSPSPRFGSIPKVAFAGLFGYLAGKISYTKTCQEKLKRLENSPIAEALRMRTGQHPPSFQKSQSEPSSLDSRSGESVFQPTESQSQTPDISRDYGYGYNDEPPMQIERPDDFSGPASYPSYVEEELPKKKTILYEDLRQKNRENYEVILNQKADTHLRTPPEKVSERPKKEEKKNVYGDAWEE